MDLLTDMIGRRLGGWTSLSLLIGVSVIAACLLIPQIEENRELQWEVSQLRAEKARVDEQVDSNKRFIEQVGTDATLRSRLVQRQFQLRPKDTQTLEIPGTTEPRSPFQLATVPPPERLAPYQPMGGSFLLLFREGRTRLYMMGGALILMAAGLIFDGGRTARARISTEATPLPAPVTKPQAKATPPRDDPGFPMMTAAA